MKPDEEKEYREWRKEKARAEAAAKSNPPPDQGQAPEGQPQDKGQDHENRIAELEKIVAEHGLTKKSIDDRANKETKKEEDIFGGLLDFEF